MIDQKEAFQNKTGLIKRDLVLDNYLSTSQVVVISGVRRCGKSSLLFLIKEAMGLSESEFCYCNFDDERILEMDRDKQVPVIMATNPQLLLIGDTPRLIDEWQEQPEIWNYVRHEVDVRKAKGQFILTGSANPNDDIKLHSGAGRFTVVQMDTLSWQELGYSTGIVKVSDLLQGAPPNYYEAGISLDFIIDKYWIHCRKRRYYRFACSHPENYGKGKSILSATLQ
ncbi:MAG: AAA family ATPase [Mariniphaga sp.]|nr:AAA family ATPase [Mariniphaga sp.]